MINEAQERQVSPGRLSSVSTGEQTTDAQEVELRSIGCDSIVQEQGSVQSLTRAALSWQSACATLIPETHSLPYASIVRLVR